MYHCFVVSTEQTQMEEDNLEEDANPTLTRRQTDTLLSRLRLLSRKEVS